MSQVKRKMSTWLDQIKLLRATGKMNLNGGNMRSPRGRLQPIPPHGGLLNKAKSPRCTWPRQGACGPATTPQSWLGCPPSVPSSAFQHQPGLGSLTLWAPHMPWTCCQFSFQICYLELPRVQPEYVFQPQPRCGTVKCLAGLCSGFSEGASKSSAFPEW